MKVAQVGHRLAASLLEEPSNQGGIEKAGGLEPEVVHAAGLAHDIGHPPFGHIGERVLDRFARKHGLDGFEGNAQTFRVLATLTRHFAADADASTSGMKLTARTVAASSKYPWPRSEDRSKREHRKWGYYPEDAQKFDEQVRPYLVDGHKTLEAQVMDWADDITYAVHDIEDFYTSGDIPLHRLKQRVTPDGTYESSNPFDDEFAQFWQYASTRLSAELPIPISEAEAVFRKQAAAFPEAPFDEETAVSRARVGRWVSDVITQASEACSVDENGRLIVPPQIMAIIAVMKQLTWFYVIDRPEMALAQAGQARVLRAVVRAHYKMALQHTRGLRGDGSAIDADGRLVARRPLPASLVEIARGNGLFDLQIPARDSRATADDFERAVIDYDKMRSRVIARSVVDYVSLQTEATVYEHYDLCQHGRK